MYRSSHKNVDATIAVGIYKPPSIFRTKVHLYMYESGSIKIHPINFIWGSETCINKHILESPIVVQLSLYSGI